MPFADRSNSPAAESPTVRSSTKDAKRRGITNGAMITAFYDGPPFATGLPHYGHLLASTIKARASTKQVLEWSAN